MNALTITLTVWALVVVAFVALMVYRGYLAQHESDQLFLTEEAPSAAHLENDEIIRREHSILPACKIVGGAAAFMTLVVAGVWVAGMLATAHLL